MDEHDSRAIATLLAPDFISISSTGRRETAAAVIQEIDALPKPRSTARTTIALLSVTVAGNAAVVNQRYEMNLTNSGIDGRADTTRLVTLSTDTWVNADGVWLLQKTVTNQLDYYKNGQLVTHKSNPQP